MNLCGGKLVCEKLAVSFAKAVTAAVLLCSQFFPFVVFVFEQETVSNPALVFCSTQC